jgi:hypothetical protein
VIVERDATAKRRPTISFTSFVAAGTMRFNSRCRSQPFEGLLHPVVSVRTAAHSDHNELIALNSELVSDVTSVVVWIGGADDVLHELIASDLVGSLLALHSESVTELVG